MSDDQPMAYSRSIAPRSKRRHHGAIKRQFSTSLHERAQSERHRGMIPVCKACKHIQLGLSFQLA